MSNDGSRDEHSPREAPTSDGADNARYSSSHKLQASHAEEPLPKVVLDRPPMRPTVRIDRLTKRVAGRRVVGPFFLLLAATFLTLVVLRRWGATQKVDAARENPRASALVPVDTPHGRPSSSARP
jgi:hypothetical protein